jgi:diketogulonate reductase-like aldo/keto reductase
MAENIDVFDFELTNDQMARIAWPATGDTLFFDHHDPSGSPGSPAAASLTRRKHELE